MKSMMELLMVPWLSQEKRLKNGFRKLEMDRLASMRKSVAVSAGLERIARQVRKATDEELNGLLKR